MFRCVLEGPELRMVYTARWLVDVPLLFLCLLQFSPAGGALSVSGLDKGVGVYDIKTWNGDIGSEFYGTD